MTATLEHVFTHKGINVHCISTAKFKTTTFVLKLIAPLERETVTMRALLPNILEKSTKRFPTERQLRTFLEEQYGAQLWTDVAKKGPHHILTYRAEVVNEKYLATTESLSATILQLLLEVAFPSSDYTIAESLLAQEKTLHRARLQSVYDDKTRFAQKRLIETMYANEAYGIDAEGELAEVEALTAEQLQRYLQGAYLAQRVQLYVIGDVQEETVRRWLDDLQVPALQEKTYEATIAAPVRVTETVVETQPIKQAKLHIGYTTGTTFHDADFAALQMMNGLLGGFAHSKLFMNVREKASLAYYVASRIDSHQALLYILAGIDADKEAEAVAIIQEQIAALQRGEISDVELDQTKQLLVNGLTETLDSAHGYAELLVNEAISTRQRPVAQWLDEVRAVTKDDIVRVSQSLQHAVTYVLKGGDAK